MRNVQKSKKHFVIFGPIYEPPLKSGNLKFKK
jgi:hypothetical protein